MGDWYWRMNLQIPLNSMARVKVVIGISLVGCVVSVFGQILSDASNPPLRRSVGRAGVLVDVGWVHPVTTCRGLDRQGVATWFS